MVKTKLNVSIIIPAYNEEVSIKDTLEKISLILSEEEINYEIIVVDDGSTDNTKQIIKQFKKVVLLEHLNNQGYGASLKDGIKIAKFPWILITDADGTYPIEEIPNLCKFVPDYDMVVGARIKKSAKIPSLRKPAKWFLNKLANYLTHTEIPDLNSGLRIFRKEIALRFMSLFPNGFSFTTTITIASLTNDYKVKYIPIDYFKREGKSTISPIRDFVGFTQLIIRLVLYFRPLNFFIPMSLLLLVFSIVWSTKDLFQYCIGGFWSCRIGLFSAMVFLFAMQILFFGLLADLMIKRTKL